MRTLGGAALKTTGCGVDKRGAIGLPAGDQGRTTITKGARARERNSGKRFGVCSSVWTIALLGALIAPIAAAQGPIVTTIRVIAAGNGTFELFGIGGDGAAYRRTQSAANDCWNPWRSLQGTELRALAPALNADGRLELFVVGADGAAYHKWQSSAGGEWGEWAALGGTDLRQVAAARNQDGRLELFALGADGAVYHKWQTSAGGGFGAWAALQGTMLREIAAAANADGRLEIFAIGGDGAIYHNWQTSAGAGFGDWAALEGRELRRLTAARNADGRLQVFALGGDLAIYDNAVYHKSQASAAAGFGEWSSLQAPYLLDVTAAVTVDGRVELFGLSGRRDITHAWQTSAGGQWGAWVGLATCNPRAPYGSELAAHWAPVLSQDVDDANVRADYVTRFDYDGDWAGFNNWDNLDGHALPAYVYYWVTETVSHYFVGYAFFHPRDWTTALLPGVVDPFGTDHNNDLEGVLLTIAKDPGLPFGRFLSMHTVAHTDFYSFIDDYTPPSSPWFPQLDGSSSVGEGDYDADIDGDVDFVADDFGLHPVVYVEAEGHGVYGVQGAGYGVTDWSPIFEDEGIVDWQQADWTGMPAPRRSGAPGAPGASYDTGSWGDGVIYHYEGTADVPTDAEDWQVIGYALTPIDTMWQRREDYGCPERERTFESDGNFAGGGEAQAPWGLDDSNDAVPRGWFFTEPAFLVSSYFTNIGLPASPTPYTAYSYPHSAAPYPTCSP